MARSTPLSYQSLGKAEVHRYSIQSLRKSSDDIQKGKEKVSKEVRKKEWKKERKKERMKERKEKKREEKKRKKVQQVASWQK